MYDDDFSQLTNAYDFAVDRTRKILSVFEGGGCCWHQRIDYEVRNGKPFLVASHTRNGLAIEGITIETEELWDEEKQQLTKKETKYFEGSNSNILSFTLESGKRNVSIYPSMDNNNIIFVLNDSESYLVEVCYPQSFVAAEGNLSSTFSFTQNATMKMLCFTQNDVEYCVYDSDNELGVTILQNGKEQRLLGDRSSRYGSLNEIKEHTNVVFTHP